MQDQDFLIRQPRPGDLNFIFESFKKCVKRESDLGRAMPSDLFYKEFQEIVDMLLQGSEVLVACSSEVEDCILGYLVYDHPNVVHFAWIRPAIRMKDLARSLVREAFGIASAPQLVFTIYTNDAKRIHKKYPELTFNPFVLYKKEPNHG